MARKKKPLITRPKKTWEMSPTRFKHIRVDLLQMTQSEMAHLLGMAERTIGHWEGGTREIRKSIQKSLEMILEHKGLVEGVYGRKYFNTFHQAAAAGLEGEIKQADGKFYVDTEGA